MNPAPAIATSNIAASPGSTFAGVGVLATGLAQTIATGGLPTSTAGWIVFGLQMFGGLFGILGR